jgi:hypothetical protein
MHVIGNGNLVLAVGDLAVSAIFGGTGCDLLHETTPRAAIRRSAFLLTLAQIHFFEIAVEWDHDSDACVENRNLTR